MTQPSLSRQEHDTTPAWYRPVIGLPWSAGPCSGLFAPVWRAYTQAIELAGGTPLWLPRQHIRRPSPRYGSGWMACCCPAGSMSTPRRMARGRPRCWGRVDPAADQVELWLAQEALERDLPLLGINRGAQVLNVSRQGGYRKEPASWDQFPLTLD